MLCKAVAFQSCGRLGRYCACHLCFPICCESLRDTPGRFLQALDGGESTFPWRLHGSCCHCLPLNVVGGRRCPQSEGSGVTNGCSSLTWSKHFGEGIHASATHSVQSAGQGAIEGFIKKPSTCCWHTPLRECHPAPLRPHACSAHRSTGTACDRSYCSNGCIRKVNGNVSASGVAISLSLLVKLSEKCEHFLLLVRLLICATLGLTLAPTSLFPSTALLP